MSKRVSRLGEIELSVHHVVSDGHPSHIQEYEIHAGTADVIEIPEQLAAKVKTVTGVDIETERVQCGAEIRIVESSAEEVDAQ